MNLTSPWMINKLPCRVFLLYFAKILLRVKKLDWVNSLIHQVHRYTQKRWEPVAKVYVINNDGTTEAMSEIHCKNEDIELQRILENNPDLIPGDQTNPTDPRRWLVVKREMPVPDPSTGDNRWSIEYIL